MTVKTKINEALKWWWASFELEHDKPKNGIVRLIVALAAAVAIFITAIFLIKFIVSIRYSIYILMFIAIAYFQTPKYTWTEVRDYIKAQAKSVFGDTEQ